MFEYYLKAWRNRIHRALGASAALPEQELISKLVQQGAVTPADAGVIVDSLERTRRAGYSGEDLIKSLINNLEKILADVSQSGHPRKRGN